MCCSPEAVVGGGGGGGSVPVMNQTVFVQAFILWGESSDMEYWACCRDGRNLPPEANLPSDMSFCSHGCFVASNREFQSMVTFEIVTPPCRLAPHARSGNHAVGGRGAAVGRHENCGYAKDPKATTVSSAH